MYCSSILINMHLLSIYSSRQLMFVFLFLYHSPMLLYTIFWLLYKILNKKEVYICYFMRLLINLIVMSLFINLASDRNECAQALQLALANCVYIHIFCYMNWLDPIVSNWDMYCNIRKGLVPQMNRNWLWTACETQRIA